jgi:hypothetical protein
MDIKERKVKRNLNLRTEKQVPKAEEENLLLNSSISSVLAAL